tara:strand:- start:1459 stop:1626 length:168 start_codon:yes stop_codon:yes gene_type:complete
MIDLLKKGWLVLPLAVIAAVVFLSGCIEAGSTSGGATSDATGGSSTQTQEQAPAE